MCLHTTQSRSIFCSDSKHKLSSVLFCGLDLRYWSQRMIKIPRNHWTCARRLQRLVKTFHISKLDFGGEQPPFKRWPDRCWRLRSPSACQAILNTTFWAQWSWGCCMARLNFRNVNHAWSNSKFEILLWNFVLTNRSWIDSRARAEIREPWKL